MLTRLIHPETGEQVVTTERGVDALKALGYTEPDSAPKKKSPAKKDGGESGAAKPLDKMKMTELLDYAEQAGIDTDTLALLAKPGTSKASVIAAIREKEGEAA